MRKLIKQGVSKQNITLIGFSRGAFISALTSHNLAAFEINTVLLAGCGRIVGNRYQNINIHGHFLSIYETTDGAQSCQKLQKRSKHILSFEEVDITTGEEHGAFYRPYPDWIVPLKKWLHAH